MSHHSDLAFRLPENSGTAASDSAMASLLNIFLRVTCGLALVLHCGSGLAQEPGRGKTIPIHDIEMYYEESGSGEPLLLLHGFSVSGQVWHDFVPELATEYRVIVPDLRGHGRSTNPSGQFTHRQCARDIAVLMDKLGIRKAKAMGISTGGMTLLHLATQQPDRLEAMILIGATIYFPEQAREIMRRTQVDGLRSEELERQRRIHVRGDAQIRALRRQFHNFKDSYDDMNFTPPYLSTIKARTLIVHGDRDEFFPVNIPVEMYKAIPSSALWIIPDGGHVPIFDRELPFLPVAKRFLRQTRVTE